MGRKSKRCQKKCQKHRFLLKPVHYTAIFSRQLEASFCPPCLTDPSITPKFNKDKRHYTNCFFLPIDSKKLQSNDDIYKSEHQKYKEENVTEKSNILIPKPRSKCSYCNVCKIDYDDYLEVLMKNIKHIKSGDHKKKLKENKFNVFINQICEQVDQKAKKTTLSEAQSLQQMQKDKILLSFSQETIFPEDRLALKLAPNPSQSFEYKQINDLLYSCKSFHAFSDYLDINNIVHHDEQQAILINPPFSPIKKYSEATEGMRLVSNIKPIILFGGNHYEGNL